MTDVHALLSLLQITDGLFPAGAFAHSLGLETYAQAGLVNDGAGVEAFVRAHLEGSAGPGDAVAVVAAARAARGARSAGTSDGIDAAFEACVAIDARIDAMRVVPEFNAASKQMGRQTLRVATAWERDAAGDDGRRAGLVERFAGSVDAGATPGHYPVVFGLVAGRAGIDGESAAAAYLYATASMLVNAALRLVAIGQLEGQRLLAAQRPRIARLATSAARASLDEMWSFTPGLELAGLRHAELDMRLFRS